MKQQWTDISRLNVYDIREVSNMLEHLAKYMREKDESPICAVDLLKLKDYLIYLSNRGCYGKESS